MNLIRIIKQKILTGSSFRKDVLWSFSTQIIVLLLAFGITKVASNRLSVDDFGQYNVIRRSVSVISYIMLAGMGITLPRYMAFFQGAYNYRKMIDLTVSSIIFVGAASIITCVVGIVFSEYLMPIVTGTSDASIYWIAVAFAFGTAISTFLIAYYRGVNDFKKYSISQVALQMLIFLSIVLVPSINVKIIFLTWFIVSVLLTLSFFLFENHRNKSILFRGLRTSQIQGMMKIISLYTTPRLVGDFFLFSFSAFPIVYLSQKMSMSDVAYYSVGLTVVNMATPVFSFLGVVLLPYVSSAISKGNFGDAEHLIRRLAIWYIILALLTTIAFWVFMPTIINIFFSPDYLVSKEYSRILLMSVLPQSMYLLYRNPLDAVTALPFNTIILLVSCAVLILLFYNSSTLTDYSYSFVIASVIQGGLSVIAWSIIRRKVKYNIHNN